VVPTHVYTILVVMGQNPSLGRMNPPCRNRVGEGPFWHGFFTLRNLNIFSLQKPGMNEASFIQASMAVGKGHYT
jgi:hypothetical protein